MNNLIRTLFGTSPRTTIMGYIGAIGVALWPIISKETFDIHNDWKFLLAAAFTAIYGRVSKDSNGVTRQEGKALAEKIDPIPKESIL